MSNFDDSPDWANPEIKRRRRLKILLGVGIAVIVVGLVLWFTYGV